MNRGPKPRYHDAIRELAAKGLTRREIATELDIEMTNVCRTVRKLKIGCKPSYRSVTHPTFWTAERVALLDELRDSGLSWWECGKAINAPALSCRQVRGRHGYYAKFGGRNE